MIEKFFGFNTENDAQLEQGLEQAVFGVLHVLYSSIKKDTFCSNLRG